MRAMFIRCISVSASPEKSCCRRVLFSFQKTRGVVGLRRVSIQNMKYPESCITRSTFAYESFSRAVNPFSERTLSPPLMT